MTEERQSGVRELLATAQTALEEGRHQEATAACRHVLRDYPDAITALRLLGEAYLETGRPDEVARIFERVLVCDPFNVLARVGLGVLAEDRGDDEGAIVQFRLAWEVSPALPQLRSELVRLYRKRYGAGGRLRMTRVSLANLHARNEDLPRAIRQFQLLHGEEPGRLDVAVGLAEVLWRHGDDAEARSLCRALLAARPILLRPLLLLAAILGDSPESGAADEAAALLARARALDPDAALARDLLALRPSPTLRRFADAPVTLAPFDPAALAVDGTDEVLGERTTTGADSFRWEEIAEGFAEGAIPSAGTGEVAPGGVASEDDVDALFAAIDRQLATVDAPGARDPAGSAAGVPPAATAPLVAWDDAPHDELEPAPDELTAVERLAANWDNIDNELAAARPGDEVPVGMTGMLDALEEELLPFDVESDSEPVPEDTLIFDPSTFSLPPLDGEDDEELDPAFESDALGLEIQPFDLAEAGPRVKTGGLTFSELIQQQREAAAPTAGEDRVAALADIDSIFATRDLAALSNEDRLVGVQSAAVRLPALPDTAAPSDGVSAQTHAMPHEAAQTPEGEDALLSPEDVAAPSAHSVETLLGRERPQAELPETAADPAMTRSILPFASEDAPGTPLAAQQSGVSPADGDMGELFGRPPQRKRAPLITEELAQQGAQAFEPVQRTPAADPADDLADDPAADGAMLDAWVRGGTAPIAPDEPGQADEFRPFATDAVNLDEWIMSGSADELSARVPLAADPDEDADDDWLIGLGESVAPSFAGEDSVIAPSDFAGEDRATARTDFAGEDSEIAPTNFAGLIDTPAVAPSPPPAASEPPPAPAPRNGNGRADDPLPWPEEVPGLAARAAQPPVAARAGEPPYTNGHRPGATEPEVAPAPPPAREDPRAAQLMAQRHSDQLAVLETLVAADPGNHFARLTLAVAYSDGLPERALNEYRRLIKESAELVPEVIERLKEMIADGGAPARVHRVLGDAYMKLGQFDLAMAEFQRALTGRLRLPTP